MRAYMKNFFVFCGIVIFSVSTGIAVENPLDTALDGAMVRYNGHYFAMSAETNGQMVVSNDLWNWGAPATVLQDEVAGPYDLMYRNGLFYLFADGKGFAVSDQPNKDYSPLRKAGISGGEMRMYQDPAGMLFSVHRRQGSKSEGEIWLQRYKASWKTYDKPIQLLDGRRGQWDSLDSAELGEPDIFGYRGMYYLLYAANHPGPRTGLREVGVAMNENPLRLRNEDKVFDPVLIRNAERLARTYKTILPSGEYVGWKARYTTNQPKEGWTKPDYHYSKWRTGLGGFGAPDEVNGAQIFAVRTQWDKDRIWVRREFDLLEGIPQTPVLNIRHEGAVQVYINGHKVYESLDPSISYSNFDITEQAQGLFRNENNVIAVQGVSRKGSRFKFLDFGLFDARKYPVEPTVYGLTSPRLIEGPNGFEKWMTYQAWWNGKKGTGLDRVFFFEREMVVDGPTTDVSEGYHPLPAKPTFSDAFDAQEMSVLAKQWKSSGGAWERVDGVLRQSKSNGVAKSYLNRDPKENYLFETEFSTSKKSAGDVGVVAWSDGKNDLIVSINPSKKTWEYHIEPGNRESKTFKLPASFKVQENPPSINSKVNPLHRLRITKNGRNFGVELDGINLLPKKPMITQISAPGIPGLYCRKSSAEFDAITYTVGWDEFGEYITGWGKARDGLAFDGKWELHKEWGLQQHSHSKLGRAFKGDLLQQYEFTVNARLDQLEEGKDSLYGIYPVYADENNYLKAMINTQARELVVTGKLNGREIRSVHKSLNTKVVHRHRYDKKTKYTHITSWIYGLRSESIINGMFIRWLDGDFKHLRQEFFVPTDDMVTRYAQLGRGTEPQHTLWDDGRFYDADEPRPEQQFAGIHNPVIVRPLKADYMGYGFFVSSSLVYNKLTKKYREPEPGEKLMPYERYEDSSSESDTVARPQETVFSLEVESSYFFRCVKLDDRVIIELNGRPMAEIAGEWPASQVGLITEGQPAFFNGMTLFHLPEELSE